MGDALAAYRISVSSVTGYSPYYLLYVWRPRMALEKTLSVRTDDHFGNRLDQLAQALQQARSNTADSRTGNRNRLKQRANAPLIIKGDFVIVLAEEPSDVHIALGSDLDRHASAGIHTMDPPTTDRKNLQSPPGESPPC